MTEAIAVSAGGVRSSNCPSDKFGVPAQKMEEERTHPHTAIVAARGNENSVGAESSREDIGRDVAAGEEKERERKTEHNFLLQALTPHTAVLV